MNAGKFSDNSRVVISGFSLMHKSPHGSNLENFTGMSNELYNYKNKNLKIGEMVATLDKAGIENHPVIKNQAESLALQALKDSGLAELDPMRTDIILGGRMEHITRGIRRLVNISGDESVKGYNYSAAVIISDFLGTSSYVYSSPTTSILHSMGNSYQRILQGKADVVLGGEMCQEVSPIYRPVSGKEIIQKIQAVSGREELSFVQNHFNDFGAIFIVEDLEHVLMRGGTPYAEIESYEEYYSAEIVENLHNGGHAKNLVNQVLLALLAITLNRSPDSLCSEDCSLDFLKYIESVKRGRNIQNVTVRGLTGTGLKGMITLKRFEL